MGGALERTHGVRALDDKMSPYHVCARQQYVSYLIWPCNDLIGQDLTLDLP